MGFHIVYAVQEKPLGIVDALKEAKDFTMGDSMMLFLGDCIFEKPIQYFYDGFVKHQHQKGARVLLYEVSDPQRFGVASVEGNYITEIEEKPKQPKSNYAVVGAYLYDKTAWDKIPSITPSARGEYEITTLNNMYIQEHSLQFDIVQGKWFDAGTFQSMLDAGNVMMKSWDAS
jgi:glucose-1-phosphate thymidylyltransferase